LLLEQRCKDSFGDDDVHRGRSYFLGGRVSFDSVGPGWAATLVRGSGKMPYEVMLDWEEANFGYLTVSCDCPRFSGHLPCKHLWATILACDQRGLSRQVPGSTPLDLVLEVPGEGWEEDDDREANAWEDDDEDWSAADVPRRHDLGPMMIPRGAHALSRFVGSDLLSRAPAPRATAGDWRRQLELLRDLLGRATGPENAAGTQRRQAWFLLDVERTLQSGQPVVDLRQRETKMNGEWGKIKRLSLTRRDIATFSDAEDRELLALLLATPSPERSAGYLPYGYSYGEPRHNSSTVPAALYDTVLPRLCATGRFAWEHRDQDGDPTTSPLAWDGGAAWELALRLDRGSDPGSLAITGSLERAGESRSLAEPTVLLANGLVVFPGVVARFDAEGIFPWIVILRRDGKILVPEDKLDTLLAELFELPAVPTLRLPEDLRWREERVTPRPCLAVRALERGYGPPKLAAEVSFDYGGRSVPGRQPGAGLFDPDQRRLLVRDGDAERTALATLVELGFERPVGPERDGRDFELALKAWPGAAERLSDDGWQLEYERARLRRPGTFDLQVTTGIDWFELEGGVDFEDVRVALPELLEALRHGQRFVALGDGSQGMLPAEWLERYGPLAHLAAGSEDGSVRFLPSQAALLDALLAAAPKVDVDRKFQRIRERLRSFERIDPATEPRGFRGQLRAYQRDGLGWLRFLNDFGFGGCLADDMGLGKTVQVLALLQGRRLGRSAADRPSLVVAPRSVLHNWAEEAGRFAPRIEILVYHGPNRQALLETAGRQHLIVTTYATLRRDVAQLKDVVFDYAVLDEAQAIKNASSQTAKACRLLRARHRLALTGTPVENHLGELWSIFEFLNPGMLGRLPRLKKWSGTKSLDHDSLSMVASALRPFILRRSKEQVLADLPAKTEQTLFCDLAGKQRRLYNELRDHYRAMLTQRIRTMGIQRSKIQVLEALLRLRQAACHPGLIDEKRAQETSAKLDVLLAQLEEVLAEGHKALIFSQFVSLLTILRGVLDRREITYEYLDGRTRGRREHIERFQTDADCRLFLISLKAGGLGLNLTAADYVFILDPWWNPAVEAQAVDRAHRIGQTRPVFAYRLISRDTVEEKILELQASKRQLADAILTADGSLIRDLTAEDLRLLLG
jgi:superfamily II DNA or RNA helicase